MALPPNLNHEKLSEAALAILGLTAFRDHQVIRAWKGMDWDLIDLFVPKRVDCGSESKAKSVIFTDEGTRFAQDFLTRHFGKSAANLKKYVSAAHVRRNPGDAAMAGLVDVGARIERPSPETYGGSRVQRS